MKVTLNNFRDIYWLLSGSKIRIHSNWKNLILRYLKIRNSYSIRVLKIVILELFKDP